ncbi:MAG: TonB-dependent receptor, partial [Candidatus Marinimicrobia bacterium]|nr:TonB-dependent receptor [Candidatus Neomarinimicrobiota bacterium]
DPEKHLAFYLSADPRVEGYFKSKVPDLPEIKAEVINTWEIGYKGRLLKSLYGTLDIYRSHFSSFVSPITFITPIIVDKTLLTTDWNGNGIINESPENIVDQEDLETARANWSGSSFLVGIGSVDSSSGDNSPIIVGYANYGEVDMTGLDMSLTWFVNRSMSFDLNYSYLGLSEFLNPITGAKDPINGPRHKGAVKFQYNPPSGKTSVSISYRYVDGFLWASGIFFGEIKSYGIVDFHGSYRFNDHLALMTSISNLLDNRHFEIIGGPALGRQIVARLETRL